MVEEKVKELETTLQDITAKLDRITSITASLQQELGNKDKSE